MYIYININAYVSIILDLVSVQTVYATSLYLIEIKLNSITDKTVNIVHCMFVKLVLTWNHVASYIFIRIFGECR